MIFISLKLKSGTSKKKNMNKIFYQRRNNLPTVNEVGRLLKDKRLVKFEKNIYTQTDRNCLEIAS